MPIQHIMKPYKLVSRGATIFKAGDGSARIATTPTTTYNTGSAGTTNWETHSPIDKACSRKCTWRRIDNCNPRMAKSAPTEVMANIPIDESSSRMFKVQSQMRSQLILGNPHFVSATLIFTAVMN
jgi:hypothetical protein